MEVSFKAQTEIPSNAWACLANAPAVNRGSDHDHRQRMATSPDQHTPQTEDPKVRSVVIGPLRKQDGTAFPVGHRSGKSTRNRLGMGTEPVTDNCRNDGCSEVRGWSGQLLFLRLPKRRSKRSTRPAVSTIFMVPVKKGWLAAEISTL